MVVDYDNNVYDYLFYQKHYKNEELFVLNGNTLKPYNHHVLTMVNGITELVDRPEKTIREEVKQLMDNNKSMEKLISMVSNLNEQVKSK